MAKKLVTAATSSSAGSPPSPVMRSFAGSLLLLLVALAVFFDVMMYPRKRADVPVVKDDTAASFANTRRQTVRQTPLHRQAISASELAPADAEPEVARSAPAGIPPQPPVDAKLDAAQQPLDP